VTHRHQNPYGMGEFRTSQIWRRFVSPGGVTMYNGANALGIAVVCLRRVDGATRRFVDKNLAPS